VSREDTRTREELELAREHRTQRLREAGVYATTLAFIVLIPLVVGFLAYRHQTQQQIERVNAERVARSQAIGDFIFDQCIKGEIRDVVITDLLEIEKARLRLTLPPGAVRAALLRRLQDGHLAIEPPDEGDCNPPVTKP
jgi:preprotein translocase subunit YajC